MSQTFDFPKVAVDTPLGRLGVIATGGDQIRLHTRTGADTDPEHVDTAGTIMLNGVAYQLRLTLVAMTWVRLEDALNQDAYDLYGVWGLHRHNGIWCRRDSNTLEGATQAATAKLRTDLIPWFADWASSPAGSTLLTEGDRIERGNRIEQLRENITSKRTELSDLEVELARLMRVDVMDLIQLRDHLND